MAAAAALAEERQPVNPEALAVALSGVALVALAQLDRATRAERRRAMGRAAAAVLAAWVVTDRPVQAAPVVRALTARLRGHP